MFIIIEGTDASGKTSLIAAVENEINARVSKGVTATLHKGRPGELTRRWVLNDYVNNYQLVDFTHNNLISDRWHWGEVTYAPLKRPDTNVDGFGLLGRAGWRWVELFLLSRGASQFWLYQPLDVIRRRIESRGDDFIQADELETILSYYMVASASAASLVAKIEPDPDSLLEVPKLARHVVDLALEREEECAKLSTFPEYIGSPNPRVLLIGDRRNVNKKDAENETILPFMPVDGNSGDFLLNALPTDLWKHVGLVNANDAQVDLYNLWSTLGNPRVVVLGRLAEKAVVPSYIPKDYYEVLPHPQYVRRFHHRDREEYGKAIQRVANNEIEKDDPWILR